MIKFTASSTLKECIVAGQFIEWNDNDEQNIYDKMNFIIDINRENNPNVYNLHKRPEYDTCVLATITCIVLHWIVKCYD